MDELAQARAVLRGAGVAVAWLFGSRATGAAGRDSDVDIAVHSAAGEPPLGLLALSRLAGELEPHLSGTVDLTAFERASLELQARIVLTGQVLLHDDEPLRVRVTIEVQSKWEDVRPALAEMDRAYLAAVARRGSGTEHRR